MGTTEKIRYDIVSKNGLLILNLDGPLYAGRQTKAIGHLLNVKGVQLAQAGETPSTLVVKPTAYYEERLVELADNIVGNTAVASMMVAKVNKVATQKREASNLYDELAGLLFPGGNPFGGRRS